MEDGAMSELSLSSSVGQWVVEIPATSRLFQKHKIDFCCGGGVTLREACEKRKLVPEAILNSLNEIRLQPRASNDTDWTERSLTDLCDHIEQTHHVFVSTEIPRLGKMAKRVAQVHGEGHPELLEVESVFAELSDELSSHMMKEERVLFPAIREMEKAQAQVSFAFGSVDQPIAMMVHEHESAGRALERIRELTNDFQPPEGACHTYLALFDGLEEFETDLHIHVHKENNVLFSRASQLEKSGCV